jgi:hypothetical protein
MSSNTQKAPSIKDEGMAEPENEFAESPFQNG